MLTRLTLGDFVKHAQRTLAECAHFFLCAGRAGFPKILQILCRIFAQNLRHLDAGLSRYLSLQLKTTLERAATNLCALRNDAGRVHETVRGAPKIFGNFLIVFARARCKICVIPTLDACFFVSECNADSDNL